MSKYEAALNRIIGGLVVTFLALIMGLKVEASGIGQPLPQTGEEIAKTGLVIGGIIIVIVIIIVMIRRKHK